jgi:hypothetical protein
MYVSPIRSWMRAMVWAWIVLFAGFLPGGCASSLSSGGAPATLNPATAETVQQGGPNIRIAQGTPPGIGGTGKQDGKTPGIGGTGQIAGGSPDIGGTGIIGTVTGFGSIFVNGFEVDYAPDLPVTFKDRTVRPAALRIGQVVAVEAEGSGKRLRATRLSVHHEVAGPIERIDPARRMVIVFGQRIEIPPGIISTANGSKRVSINDLAVGEHIDVSGLRRANGVIAASRIDKTGPGEAAVLHGRVTASGQNGFSVNGVRIDAPVGSRPVTLASGQDVQIIGTAIRGRLRARRIRQLERRPFAGRMKRLSIEGYVRRATSGGVAVGRVPIVQLPTRARIQAGERVILDGTLDTRGRFAPTRLRAPQVKLRFQGEPRRNLNTRPTPPRRQAVPPAPRLPPVIRNTPPAPRPPVYRPPPRRPGR